MLQASVLAFRNGSARPDGQDEFVPAVPCDMVEPRAIIGVQFQPEMDLSGTVQFDLPVHVARSQLTRL